MIIKSCNTKSFLNNKRFVIITHKSIMATAHMYMHVHTHTHTHKHIQRYVNLFYSYHIS